MKKTACLYLLLILLSSCEEKGFRVLEKTSWQITDYKINGADSMASVIAFHLKGEFYFSDRPGMATPPTLITTTIAHDTTYNHEGTWWAEKKILEINLFRGLSHYGYGIMPKAKYGTKLIDKPSFKPFRSQWTITKLTKKDMQLELTLDNRKHYLRFKAYQL